MLQEKILPRVLKSPEQTPQKSPNYSTKSLYQIKLNDAQIYLMDRQGEH